MTNRPRTMTSKTSEASTAVPRCPVCLAVAVPWQGPRGRSYRRVKVLEGKSSSISRLAQQLSAGEGEWACSSGGLVVYKSATEGTFRHHPGGGPLFTSELVYDSLRDLVEDAGQ